MNLDPNEAIQAILRALIREQQVTEQLQTALTAANRELAELKNG